MHRRSLTASPHHTSSHRRTDRRRNEHGYTLIEVMIASLLAGILLTGLAGWTMTSMRSLSQVRGWAIDQAGTDRINRTLVNDAATALVIVTPTTGSPMLDCPGGTGSGGSPKLVMVTATKQRIVYSLAADSTALTSKGQTLFRRACPNAEVTGSTDFTQTDPLLTTTTTAATTGEGLAEGGFDGLGREAAGAQQGGGAGEADDGAFHPDIADAAVEDGLDPAREAGGDMGGGGRADPARGVGGRRGNRAAEGREQGMGDGMGGHTDGEAGQFGGDEGREAGVGGERQDEGERAGPEPAGQHLGHVGPGDIAARGGGVGDMHDQGVEAGPALGLEYPGDGEVVGGIGAEAIDRLGREGDQPAAMQDFRGARKAGGIGGKRGGNKREGHDAAFQWLGEELMLYAGLQTCIQAHRIKAKLQYERSFSCLIAPRFPTLPS